MSVPTGNILLYSLVQGGGKKTHGWACSEKNVRACSIVCKQSLVFYMKLHKINTFYLPKFPNRSLFITTISQFVK